MDDLVERLRGRARFCYDRGEIKSPGIMIEAADAIEALQARVADARRDAFEEAAKLCDEIDNQCGMEAGSAASCGPAIRALAEKG